jgi:hypothetical protein
VTFSHEFVYKHYLDAGTPAESDDDAEKPSDLPPLEKKEDPEYNQETDTDRDVRNCLVARDFAKAGMNMWNFLCVVRKIVRFCMVLNLQKMP